MPSLFGQKKDYYGGALMLFIGLASVYGGSRFQIGTLARMGPGYFPTAVGAILAAIGLVIALGAPRSAAESGGHSPFDWRAWSAIIGGVLAFVALGEYGGLVPATFGLVFISAMGDKDNSVIQALCLAAGMVVIAVVVFWWALQLQLQLFRWG